MKHLVMAGAGHAHLVVLETLVRKPLRDVRVTLLSPVAHQVYSGMLPGWMAGLYGRGECQIDVAALAARAGVEFVAMGLRRLEPAQRRIETDRGTTLDYDLLSLNTGGQLQLDAIAGLQQHGIALRPLESFLSVWERLHTQFGSSSRAFTVSVIGGGAGGVELAFAVAARGRSSAAPLRAQLIAGRDGLLPALADSVRDRVAHWLPLRQVRLVEHDAVRIEHDHVILDDRSQLASDISIVAIGAHAAAWPRAAGLAVDDRGFIRVNAFQQSVSHPEVFAAGDCASIDEHPRPKSGVYAVRAGKPLAHNLRAALAGRPLAPFVPQPQAMYLLATGPRHGIAAWGGFSAEGAWVWRLKDHIDRRFMARYPRPAPAGS